MIIDMTHIWFKIVALHHKTKSFVCGIKDKTYLVKVDYEQHNKSVDKVDQVWTIRSEENIAEVAKLKQRVNREDKTAFELLSALW